MRKHLKKITEEMRLDIIRRLLAGESHAVIAFAHDIDPSNVSLIKKSEGISRKANRSERKPCIIPDCGVISYARGLCKKDYRAARKTGSLPSRYEEVKSLNGRNMFKDPDCDHSKSSCDCLNLGRSYAAYFNNRHRVIHSDGHVQPKAC